MCIRTFLLNVVIIVLTTVSASLSLESSTYEQLTFLLNLTSTLNELHDFDNIILYSTPIEHRPIDDSSLSAGDAEEQLKRHYESLSSVGERLNRNFVYIPKMIFTISPWDYVNDTDAIPNLGIILSNKNLALVILDDIFNKELKEFVAISLGASRETKIVFLLIGDELTDVPSFIRLEKMLNFFRWCWSKNIINALLVFQKIGVAEGEDVVSEIYTYTPFPKPVEMVRLTETSPQEYFAPKTYDLKGYKFRTPVLLDKPNVFKMYYHHTRKTSITGIAGRLYLEFVQKMNGTFTEIPINESVHNAYELEFNANFLSNYEIDIAIHPRTFLLPFAAGHGHGSYPITHTNSCVVVPVIPEIYRGYYMPLTFNHFIWFNLFIIFLIFVLIHLLLHQRRYGEFYPCRAIATTMQGMLSLPVTFARHQLVLHSNNPRACMVNILQMATGLIFTTLHVATLTSLLSTTLYGRQLNTVEDLRSANITIMLLNQHAALYRYLDILPANFSSNLLISDSQTISQHQDSLNTSYAYIVYQEEWKVMCRLQSNLWKPYFRIASQLCIPNMFMALPLQFNSPFYNRLMHFTLWTQEAGLEAKWSDMVFSEIQHESGELPPVELREYPAAISMEHLMVAWYIWGFGASIALLVFCGERMIHGVYIH